MVERPCAEGTLRRASDLAARMSRQVGGDHVNGGRFERFGHTEAEGEKDGFGSQTYDVPIGVDGDDEAVANASA